jgi:DNA-binding GntR family transcriptional regulator
MLKGTTQWQVAQGIAEYIIDHDLEPGTRVIEQALAARLGVSRTPVRAVLSHLRDNGILEWKAGRGFFLKRRLRTVEDAGIGDPTAGRIYDRILLDVLNGGLKETVSENALMRRYGIERRAASDDAGRVSGTGARLRLDIRPVQRGDRPKGIPLADDARAQRPA